MNSIGNCAVCGGEIPPHIISRLGAKDGKHPVESKQWFYRDQIIMEPTYFLGDKWFCSCECAVVYYSKKEISQAT